MKKIKERETDSENRERAIAILKIIKEKELKRNLTPLKINDEDNTVLMVSAKLNHKQREKLREKIQFRLRKKQNIVIEEKM